MNSFPKEEMNSFSFLQLHIYSFFLKKCIGTLGRVWYLSYKASALIVFLEVVALDLFNQIGGTIYSQVATRYNEPVKMSAIMLF